MKIILNNDMEMMLDNNNGAGPCVAALVDSSDKEVISAAFVDEQELFEFLASKFPEGKDVKAMEAAAMQFFDDADDAQAIALQYLHRFIDDVEMMFYPILDKGLKTMRLDVNPYWPLAYLDFTEEQMQVLDTLEAEGHIAYNDTYVKCTRGFYDYLQEVLKVVFVPEFID